jgi:membrane protein implicated in regulation of membrane protease activity
MDNELAMLLKTVIPIAAVALGLLLLYSFLPLWLFVTVVVVALAVAASPKARAAVKRALAPPDDASSGEAPSDRAENKQP